MGGRTILQKQLEKSRRLLTGSELEGETKKDISKTISPSLGEFIRERNLPHIEELYDGPFQITTAAAVKNVTGDFGTIASERIQRMRQGIEAQGNMIDLDAAGESPPLNVPAWSMSEETESDDDRDGATPVWREVLSEQREYPRPSLE